MTFETKSVTPLMEFSDEEVNNILTKYERNLKTVQEDIDTIKKWIKQQNHLPQISSDQQIFIFLVMNKFSIEKTKEKLDMYYTIRTLIPDFYRDLLPSSCITSEIQKIIQFVTLPKLSKNFNRVMAYKIVDNTNPKFSSHAVHTYFLLVLEMKSLYDVSCSDEYIVDFSNLNVGMIAKYSPMDLKKIVTVIEKVFSNRIAAVHFLNLPSYAEAFITMIKSFLKEKIRNRLNFYKDMNGLHEVYSKDMLPKDFGGDEKSIAELHGFKIKSATPLMEFSDNDVNNILIKYERNLDSVQEDIDSIKKWMRSQNHLPVMPSNQQIFIFLIMNKFSIEKTKEKLDMSYTIRHLIPDFYGNLLPTSFLSREMQKTINIVLLPKLSKNYNRVFVYKIVDNANPHFSSFASFTYFLLFLEIKSLYDVSCSDEYLADFTNLTVAMVAKYSIMDLKKIVTILEKVYSNRIAALHLINLPSYGEALISLFRSLLKEKLRSRFNFYKDMQSLHKVYDKKMLPKDFGGDEKSVAELHADWVKFLDENEDHFVKMQNVKVDETKRAKKLVNDDILGFHGNFRKLAVD